jgi:hypothetical protein
LNDPYETIDELLPPEEIIRRYKLIQNDLEGVRIKDKIGIKSILNRFGEEGMDAGIGYKQAYGTVMSGDSFQLFSLHDDIFLFVFSDVSGHGLEAYTTYIKLRSSIILAVRSENERRAQNENDSINYSKIISDITNTFTDIMDDSISRDFACVLFTFVSRENEMFTFRFFNRGMYYPQLATQAENGSVTAFNMNEALDTWVPAKNSPLGSDFRKILEHKYNVNTESILTLSGGFRLLFFTDGITEATSGQNHSMEFGLARLEKNLIETFHYFPQAAINTLFTEVYDFIGDPSRQTDDMTAVLLNFTAKS